MNVHGHSRTGNRLSCSICGAGLPPSDERGVSSCFYCGTHHTGDRTSEILAVAAAIAEAPMRDRESMHDGEDAARIPMTEESILRLLRQQFSDAEPVSLCPHIPPRKENLVRQAHLVHLSDNERILALHDTSWLGHGAEGFLVTARRLAWKNAGEPACSVTWRELDPEMLSVDRHTLFVSSVAAIRIDDDAVLEACTNAFHVLALSAVPSRTVSGAAPACSLSTPTFVGPTLLTPPPDYAFQDVAGSTKAPDRRCWHCRTPLFTDTPQCGYCGVLPKKRGWLRSA